MSKRSERIVVLLTPSELEEVDRFADTLPIRPNRSDVIRELLRRGLDSTQAVHGNATTPAQAEPSPRPVSQDPSATRDGDVLERLDRLEALVVRAVGAVSSPAPAPARPAPPPEDATPALDPVAEAEGLRKLAAFVERNRLPPPPLEPPEPSIEELQAKAMALQAQRQKRPDFKPVPTNVVPAPGQGDTEPYVHLYPEEPRAPEERTSPYWDDEEG